MNIRDFFLFEAHGENAAQRVSDRQMKPTLDDPTGMEGFEGGEPGENQFAKQPTDPPSHGFEDPSSSQDAEHGGFSDDPMADGPGVDGIGGTETMEVPDGVFQDGENEENVEGFGDMDQLDNDIPPMPGGPEDPEMTQMPGVNMDDAGMQGAGFEQEVPDAGFSHQTGEPGPEHRIKPQFPAPEKRSKRSGRF